MEWYIKLHRQLIKWQRYQDGNTLRLFLHLLLKANHKDWYWMWVKILRWQYITWRTALAKDLKLSEQQVRTSLDKLKKSQNITIKTTNKYSIIEIQNYNNYQDNNQQDNQQITNKEPTNNQQITTNKNKENKENKENIISKDIYSSEIATKVATLEEYIKENFNLEFITEVYKKYNMTKVDFQEECESFVDYWKEKSPNWKKERWQKEKTFDPKLRFRTWMRNSKKWSNKVIINSVDEERKNKLKEIERKKDLLFNKQ